MNIVDLIKLLKLANIELRKKHTSFASGIVVCKYQQTVYRISRTSLQTESSLINASYNNHKIHPTQNKSEATKSAISFPLVVRNNLLC